MQPQTLDSIKAIPIIQVVQDANLQPKANKICSPFTNEKTPSLHLYTATNSFYDFSADKGGDVIDLYMGLHQIPDFTTAVQQLAKTYNIPLPELHHDNPNYREEQHQKETLHLINQAAANYFAERLNGNTTAANYLSKERLFTTETINFWQLGYDDGTLPQFLTQNQYSLEFALLAGLLNAEQHSRFYKRIIFPILNTAGKHIGFTARTIQPNPKPETPKYLNTTTTLVFEKKTLLYGLYQNKKDIKAAGAVILTEGTTDVIALWQRGYKNAVATLDKNLTPERVGELRKYTDTVILWRDSDKAGQQAVIKDLKALLSAGFTVKIIDPHSTKAKDPADWATHANTADVPPPPQEAIIWYAAEILPPTEGQPADRSKAIEQLVNIIVCLPNTEQQGLYIDEIAKQHKLKPEYFYQKLMIAPKAPVDNPPAFERKKPKYEDIHSFVRVGVNYFKWVVSLNFKTKKVENTLEKWSPEIIKLDYCKRWKNFLDEIPVFDTFCVRPDFTNLKKSHIDTDPVSGMSSYNYNLIKPLNYVPANGKFPNIKAFLTHVFGNEKSDFDSPEIGDPLTVITDCFRIKFQQPTHLLPVVCLLSKEQETGKTTFFEFVCDLFASNAVIITKDHLESQFNTTYADKLAICGEEIKVSPKEPDLKNKLKQLATATKIFYNPKGVIQREIEYYGWLMLSSNHENDFLSLEAEDKRFWITKLKTIKTKDSKLRLKMVEEIPAFVHYLLNTDIVHPEESRIWFADKYLQNEYKKNIVWQSRQAVEKAITDAVSNIFLSCLVTPERKESGNIELFFKCDMNSLVELVNAHGKYKHDPTQIKDWLKKDRNMTPGIPEKFTFPMGYDSFGNLAYKTGKGRIMKFMYFDWVRLEDLSDEAAELHQYLYKEAFETTPF